MNKNAGAKEYRCPQCGGLLEDVGQNNKVECPYCSNIYSSEDLMNESESVKIEKIKSQTYRDIEHERAKRQKEIEEIKAQTYKDIEYEKLKMEREKEKKEEDEFIRNTFKRTDFCKLLIIMSAVSAFLAFLSFGNGKIISGLIIGVSSIMFLGSWMMGMRYIDEPKKGIRFVLVVAGFAMLMLFLLIGKLRI